MEKLTLSQWTKDYCQTLRFDHTENCFVCECTNDAAFFGASRLEDFISRMGSGSTLYFNGPFSLITVKTREDFLSLSYYTLCRIADTLHLSAIGGMVNEVEKGRLKGILTVDKLGNFLIIE